MLCRTYPQYIINSQTTRHNERENRVKTEESYNSSVLSATVKAKTRDFADVSPRPLHLLARVLVMAHTSSGKPSMSSFSQPWISHEPGRLGVPAKFRCDRIQFITTPSRSDIGHFRSKNYYGQLQEIVPNAHIVKSTAAKPFNVKGFALYNCSVDKTNNYQASVLKGTLSMLGGGLTYFSQDLALQSGLCASKHTPSSV
jgi:hypothetical protein